MLRIIHYIPSIDRMAGGTSTYMQVLGKELGKLAEVHIITHVSDNPLPISNCKIHYVPTYFPFNGKFKNEVNKLFDELKPDMVHVNCCWMPACAFVQKIARKHYLKVVLTPHGMLEPWIIKRHYWTRKLPALLLYQKSAIKNADCLQATAESEKQNLLTLGYNSNIKVVKLGIDAESIAVKTSWKKSKQMLFLSRVHIKKGINYLIEAADILRDELHGYKIIVAGEGDALLQRYGLQHIGEWHSHHQLGLAHPSGHDASNMQMVVNQKHLGKFLLCIGNCGAHASTLNAFNFMEGEQSYLQASWMIKEMDSPYRRLVDYELRNILVHPHCMESNMIGLKILEEDKPLFRHDYWLCDKQNNLTLKKIVDFLCQFADNKGCEVKLDTLGYVHLFVNKSGESKEEIFFPVGFPHEAPEVKRQSGVCVTEEWNYCGDIYQAFVQFYCGCLPSPPQKDEILWNEQIF